MLAWYHADVTTRTARVAIQLLILLVFTFSWGCGEEEPDPFARAQKVEGFAKLEKKLAKLERNQYQVWGVEDDHGVLKVNVVLKPPTQDPAEVKRLTLNTLFDLQTIVSTDINLSAWAYAETEGELLGMSFYSALTEQSHFKSAAEISATPAVD